MTHAYNESYLEDAMQNLADAMDYSANDCGWKLEKFLELFISSGYAAAFGKGEPRVVAGYSGEELVHQVIAECGLKDSLPPFTPRMDRSPAFWCGWVLAYCQWKTGMTFARILEIIPIDEIAILYSPLHEASEDKFVDVVLHRKDDIPEKPTKLTRLRKT